MIGDHGWRRDARGGWHWAWRRADGLWQTDCALRLRVVEPRDSLEAPTTRCCAWCRAAVRHCGAQGWYERSGDAGDTHFGFLVGVRVYAECWLSYGVYDPIEAVAAPDPTAVCRRCRQARDAAATEGSV